MQLNVVGKIAPRKKALRVNNLVEAKIPDYA
jgi:hypothetical protein